MWNDNEWSSGQGWRMKSNNAVSVHDSAYGDYENDVAEEARPHGYSFFQPLANTGGYIERSILAERQAVDIAIKGERDGCAAPPVNAFSDLEGILPPYVTSSLAHNGIIAPVPIQQWTLPFTLRGYDVIGIAKTGSGKTLAYLLPAIAHVERFSSRHVAASSPTAIILAPVRELAMQIADEANKICTHSRSDIHPNGIGCVACYGGGGSFRSSQVCELKSGFAQIVVGTPGRLVDFVSNGILDASRVVFFVLDEADRMLDGGYEDHLNQISAKIQPDRQTLFFSATWPAHVRKCAKEFCKSPPVRVCVGQEEDGDSHGPTTRSDIVQEVLVFDGGLQHPPPYQIREKIWNEKKERMNSHLRKCLENRDNKILVFVNTKDMAREISQQLTSEGFAADFMSGDRSQIDRQDTVRKFKEGQCKLLVSTDVMARGLDIQGITHVLVHDCYGNIDDYVHRIGRTSRGFQQACGHALIFYEFDPNFASMPADIINVLNSANQPVPPQLQRIADEVEQGLRKAVGGTSKKKRKWK